MPAFLIISPQRVNSLRTKLSSSGRVMVAGSCPISLSFVRAGSAPLAQVEQECRFFLSRLAPEAGLASLPPLADNPYFEVPPAL